MVGLIDNIKKETLAMTKVKEVNTEEVKIEESKPTIKTTIESLGVQLKDYREKREYYIMMTLKAEGALEVLNQLDDDGES